MITRRTALSISALAIAGAAATLTLGADAGPKAAPVFTGLVKGMAVGGYDAVAYFTESKPVKGRNDITLEHQGVTWRFATEANREAFRADPARYAPQYGGYCAWAVSEGYTAKGDPEAWTIHDGRLYLNYNKKVQRDWEKAIPANIRRGDTNWPKLVAN